MGIYIAMAVKTPLVPFHLWLPSAHSEADLGGSIILAGRQYAQVKFNKMLRLEREAPKRLAGNKKIKGTSEA